MHGAAAAEQILNPELLAYGRVGEPRDETEDALHDDNEIRDAIRKARGWSVGTDACFKAVGEARTQNKHLDEEEREALPDFVKSTTPDQRHDLAMRWLQFVHAHAGGQGISGAARTPRSTSRSTSRSTADTVRHRLMAHAVLSSCQPVLLPVDSAGGPP